MKWKIGDWKSLWKAVEKYKYVLLILLVGIVFMLWPSGQQEERSVESAGVAAFDLEAEEQRLEKLLTRVQGVGEVKVMLSLASSTEQILAQDNALTYAGQVTAPDDYQREETTVILSQGSNGEEVVVTKEVYPTYRGALVVCSGAGDTQVRLAVIQAVSAITGLGSDKISVCAWGED